MIFGTSNLEKEYIGVRNCHLCGEEFEVEMYVADTICPRCKEAWKAFISTQGSEEAAE